MAPDRAWTDCRSRTNALLRSLNRRRRRFSPAVTQRTRACVDPAGLGGDILFSGASKEIMKAAWYEKQGVARDVLIVGEMDDPQPSAGEVRIRVAASGVNPGDVKKREDTFGLGMPYPRVIPHSDGAGTVDLVGADVPPEWIGRVCGVTEPNRIVLLGPLPNIQPSLCRRWSACPKQFQWSRAPVLAFPA